MPSAPVETKKLELQQNKPQMLALPNQKQAELTLQGVKENVATVLPGADSGDQGPIGIGHLIETTPGGGGSPIKLDLDTIKAKSNET